MRQRMRIRIEGRVQGVCFRMYTEEQAAALGVTGWVRNNDDGSVEVLAEGEAADVDALLAWCRHGPPHGQVTQLAHRLEPATGEFKEFFIAG